MTIRVGRLFGIPIYIEASWFIVLVLVVFVLAEGYFPQTQSGSGTVANWLAAVITALMLFGSVLLHELVHSVVARRNNVGISGITLFIFGGVSRLKDEPHSPEVELEMALAGPLTSFGLAAVFGGTALYFGKDTLGILGFEVLKYLAIINLILGLFNLLPGFPLDGGRVFRAILWGVTGSLERATRYASYTGQGLGYLFIFLGFWLLVFRQWLSGGWFIFIGWYLNNAAQQSYQQLVIRRALSGVDVHRVMTTDFPHIDPNTSVYDFVHDYLLRYDYSAFPVVSDDTLIGIVTVDEVREVPREEWDSRNVGEIARPPDEERVVDENDDAFNALMHMAESNVRRLLVMHDGKLKGIVTQESIIHLVRTKMRIGM
jgi:Zn-dependent protease/CBS domain-containing protein